jgi:hypothetical protein
MRAGSMTTRDSSSTELAALGGATAQSILATFEQRRLVPAFVDAYVRKHNRRELKVSPLRNRELLLMLTRESLVAMAARLQAELPRRLWPKGRGARKPQPAAAAQAADSFLQAFIEAIAASLRWSPGDVAEFAADVALYRRMAAFAAQRAMPATPARGRADRSGRTSPLHLRSRAMDRAPGPFADRCAMLLDPSLMEKARAAACELHRELETIATAALTSALRTKGL